MTSKRTIATAGAGQRKIALTNVRVFDGRGLSEPTTVVIDGATIGADADDARVVDGGGGVLLPGLIDAHIHLSDLDTLRELSAYGVTTALDMGCWPMTLVDSLRGHRGLTDVRSAGVAATSPASRHGQRMGGPPHRLVTDQDSARRYVADRVLEGVDYIKIIIDLPGFDQDTTDALVSAAHHHGKRAIAHASTFDAVAMAQSAGVDVVTHTPLDRELDELAASQMLADKRIIVPTLVMMEAIAAKFPTTDAAEGPSFDAARASISTLHSAGVPILVGTDANNAAGAPASPSFGESMHRELELLVDAGLSTTDALRSATVLPALHFGLPDRGVVAPGRRADLVLLAGDPIADIRATRHIEQVWCAGIERIRP